MELAELDLELRQELREMKPALPADVPSASLFRDDLKLDSLDLVEFVARIEMRFTLAIPDEDLPRLVSLAATADYVRARFA